MKQTPFNTLVQVAEISQIFVSKIEKLSFCMLVVFFPFASSAGASVFSFYLFTCDPCKEV